MKASCAVALALVAHAPPARADEAERPRVRLDGSVAFSRFEQQVKSEVGSQSGDKLVVHTELGLLSMLTYRFWGPLSAGGYSQFDAGKRSAARFAGFGPDGRTQTESEVGGSYTELWFGPVLRAEWRQVFAELGYGAYGSRHDAARDDLPSESGDTSSALRTHPTIAWLFALGGGLPVTDALSAVLRVEYRVRYYVSRGGSALGGDIVHGTQNLTPLIGVAWSLGPR